MNKNLYIALLFYLPVNVAAADAKKVAEKEVSTKIVTPSTIQSPRSAFSLVSPRSVGSCDSFRSDSRISVGCSDTSEIFIPTPEHWRILSEALSKTAHAFEEGQQKAAEQAKATAQAAKLEARKKAASEEKIKEIQRSVVGCPIS